MIFTNENIYVQKVICKHLDHGNCDIFLTKQIKHYAYVTRTTMLIFLVLHKRMKNPP